MGRGRARYAIGGQSVSGVWSLPDGQRYSASVLASIEYKIDRLVRDQLDEIVAAELYREANNPPPAPAPS